MISELRNELALMSALTLLLIAIVALFPSSVLRGVLGAPFMLFIPGYTLVAVLFPARQAISTVERLALSVGASIVVVSLIGAVLNFTPLGVRLVPVLCSVSGFTLATSAMAWWRRRKLPQEKQSGIRF